jgi:hypothetical protein
MAGFFLLGLFAHKSMANMPVSYYFGFTAPFLALLLGFGVDAVPRLIPVLVGLLIVSVATPMDLVVPAGNARRIVAAIRPHCRGCVIVVGSGFGRGVPGSMVYEADTIPVLVLADNLAGTVEQAKTFGRVYFVPSNEPRTTRVEKAFVQALRLQPAGENLTAVP